MIRIEPQKGFLSVGTAGMAVEPGLAGSVARAAIVGNGTVGLMAGTTVLAGVGVSGT